MKRALLIGCATFGLEGPEYDVRRMAAALDAYGFDSRSLCGREAGNAAIVDALEALITASRPHDTVLIYYSGHGGLAFAEGHDETMHGTSPYLQFLVPTDMEDAPPDDFRGIPEFVLTDWVARLTSITRNIILILDCCHSARMVRTRHFRLKLKSLSPSPRLPRPPQALFAEARRTRPFPGGNPYAVRLAASGALLPAYETIIGGLAGGLLTDAFCHALQWARDNPVNWRVLGGWVREKVLSQTGTQRPELEGPTSRALFDTQAIEECEPLVFYYQNPLALSGPALRGGFLHGVTEGSVYGLHPRGGPEGQMEIKVKVTRVFGGISHVQSIDDADRIPMPGMRAQLLEVAAARFPVLVDPDFPAFQELTGATDFYLTRETPDDVVLANVRREPGGFVAELNEQPLVPAVSRPDLLSDTLTRLARVRRLCALESRDGTKLRQPYELQWGKIKQGKTVPLPYRGSKLNEGDQVYLELHNLSQQPLFLNVFAIDIERQFQLLNHDQQSGALVFSGERYCLGFDPQNGKAWWRLAWPVSSRFATDQAFPENLVVIITDTPQDLASWAQPRTYRGNNPLAADLAQVWGSRCFRSEKNSIAYDIVQIEYMFGK